MEQEPVMMNNHHVFFTRREYKTPIERHVRNLGAFIIKANAVDHQEMHIQVPPPPKPDHDQLCDLYNFMQERNYNIENLDGLAWGIVWANDRKLYLLEENLDQQYYYLSGDYRK
jgi:hypothetical protein